MNWGTVKGNWTLVRGTAKLQWGKLSGDQRTRMAGRHDHPTGEIQKTCGANQQVMEEQRKEFVGPHKDYGARR
jgi:uncharacterized protein YjbJ (UPF0337 family)